MAESSSVTDIHAHVIPRATLERLRREFPAVAPVEVERDGARFLDYPSGRRSGPLPDGMLDEEARLRDMRGQGVDREAVSVPPSHFFYAVEPSMAAELAELLNEGMRDLARADRDSFTVLATLPMQDAEASVREIGRLSGAEEVRGIEIGTNITGRNLDDDAFEPVWMAAEAADLPILLHPDEVAGADRMRSYYLQNFVGNPTDSTIALASLIFGGVFERHPALRVGLCHGGGFVPYQIGRWDHGWSRRKEAQVRISRPPSTYLENVYIDSLTHDPLSLRFLVERVGAERVMLGSDYPFDMAPTDPVGAVAAAGLPSGAPDAILRTTPERFLRRRAGAVDG